MQKSTEKRLGTSSLDLWLHVQSILVSHTKFYDMHVLDTSWVAHQAGDYPGLCSIEQLGVFLLLSGWDVSLSRGYPSA